LPFLNELKLTLPNVKAYRLMQQLFKENQGLNDIIYHSRTLGQAKKRLKTWALDVLSENKAAYSYFIREKIGQGQLEKLRSVTMRPLGFWIISGIQANNLKTLISKGKLWKMIPLLFSCNVVAREPVVERLLFFMI
jgi:hypothetical protein